MADNRYFPNPWLLPPTTTINRTNVALSRSMFETRGRLDSKVFLVQKAYQLFQKCRSYYEKHGMTTSEMDTVTADRARIHATSSSSAISIHPQYIGSLYIGGLGSCAYLRWKLASSPYLGCLLPDAVVRPKGHEDENTAEDSRIKIEIRQLQRELLQSALDIVHQSLQYHRWVYPRCTLLEGPVVGALVVQCVVLYSLLLLLRQEEDERSQLCCKAKTMPRDESDSKQEEYYRKEIDSAFQHLLRIATLVRSWDPNECEVLYGRSGYLLAIHFLISRMGDTLNSSNCDIKSSVAIPILQDILRCGKNMARKENIRCSIQSPLDAPPRPPVTSSHVLSSTKQFPLLWKWHESFYLGAAHGIVGILYTLLCFHSEIQQMSLLSTKTQAQNATMSLIKDSVDGLDCFCFPSSGNLASSIQLTGDRKMDAETSSKTAFVSPEKDRLVHFCHGATGYVLLLVKAYEVLGEESYLIKAQNIARNVIYPRGLLKKGVGLCHGISGSAYAFLTLHRVTLEQKNQRSTVTDAVGNESIGVLSMAHSMDREKDTEWLVMAKNFAAFALEHLEELEDIPDRPYSLYEGLAGLSSLLIDLCNPDQAQFPCF